MIIGSYRELVLPFDEMPVIFKGGDQKPKNNTSEDIFVHDLDGLKDFETTYNSHTGNVFVGIVARVLGPVANADLNATFGGMPMTRAAFSRPSSGNSGFVLALFGLKGGPIGDSVLKITGADNVNIGMAAIKISNANSLPDDWLVGASAYSTFLSSTSANGVYSGPVEIEGSSTGLTCICFGGVDQYEAYPIEDYIDAKSNMNTERFTIIPESFGRERFPNVVPDENFTNSYVFGRKKLGPEATDGEVDGLIRFRGVRAKLYGVCTAVIRGNFED